MVASIQHIVALAGGMKKKGGGLIKLEDFAPQLRKPEDREKKLQRQLMMLAANQKAKPNGRK